MKAKFILNQAEFSADLLKKTYSTEENVLVSPLSVMLALCMVATGAKYKTRNEMKKVLSHGKSLSGHWNDLSEYVRSLPSSDGCKFHFADSLWFPETTEVLEKFRTSCKNLFDAEAVTLPFDAEAVKKINSWVSEHTFEMIDSVIDSVSPEALMYVINALAFDAEWERIYRESEVDDVEFKNVDNSSSTVKGMYSEEAGYIETEDCIGFLKPYKGQNYSFAALLPKDGDLTGFVNKMDGIRLFTTLALAQNEECDAMLPKFKVEYSKMLNSVLRALGIETAFGSEADFSGITKQPMSIGEVIHKTYMEVDERGTKAGAVTAIMMKMMSMPMPKPQVYLDRPFVYAIVDNRTKLPIFLGTVVKM